MVGICPFFGFEVAVYFLNSFTHMNSYRNIEMIKLFQKLTNERKNYQIDEWMDR